MVFKRAIIINTDMAQLGQTFRALKLSTALKAVLFTNMATSETVQRALRVDIDAAAIRAHLYIIQVSAVGYIVLTIFYSRSPGVPGC